MALLEDNNEFKGWDVKFIMGITRYTSLEKEVFVCKKDKDGSDWRKRIELDGFEQYTLINDAIYVPKQFVSKILPIIKNEQITLTDCNKLFGKFRNQSYSQRGGRIFTLSYDDSLGYSSEIGEISDFESLVGFENVF